MISTPTVPMTRKPRLEAAERPSYSSINTPCLCFAASVIAGEQDCKMARRSATPYILPRRRNLWVIFSLWSGNPSPSLDVDVSVSGMEDTSVRRRQAALEPGQGQAAAFCSLA